MKIHILVPLLLSVSLAACVGDDGIEDLADDVFTSDDGKADAFGIEDWSPDGMAVLRLVSTASVVELDDDVGLSSRVARLIVERRAELDGNRYTNLKQLDDVKYVGPATFARIVRYVADNHLFKTSLRIPLIVEGTSSSSSNVAITSYNDHARAVGVTGFAPYTYVSADTDFYAKMIKYDERLQLLATLAGITIDGEMMRFNSTVNDYTIGASGPCFIGDAAEVPDVATSQVDGLLGDMYSLWAYRYDETTWTYYDEMDESELGDAWSRFDTSSTSVLLVSTNSDGGEWPSSDLIPRCR